MLLMLVPSHYVVLVDEISMWSIDLSNCSLNNCGCAWRWLMKQSNNCNSNNGCCQNWLRWFVCVVSSFNNLNNLLLFE